MSLWVFFFASLAGWVILRFGVGRRLQRSLLSGPPEERLRAVGWIPVAGLAGWAALLSVISSGGLLLAAAWISRHPAGSLAEFEALLARLEGMRHWLAGISLGWFIFVAIVGFAGLSKLLYERSRGRLKAALDQRVERELAALAERARRGDLRDLPPTLEMQQVREKIAEITDLMNRAHQAGDARQEQVFGDYRQKLYDALQAMDIRRRLNLDLDEREMPLRKPETAWEKFTFALFSEGVAAHATGSSLILVALLSLLLLPAWVGVQRGSLLDRLDGRIAVTKKETEDERLRLADLTLLAHQKEAAATLEQALAQAASSAPAPAAKTEKEKEDDESTINQVAARVEASYFRARGARVPEVSADTVARTRSASARDRILQSHASASSGRVEHVSSSDGLQQADRKFAEAVAAADQPPRPSSSFGERVAEDLRRASKSKGAGFMENLRTSLQRATSVESMGRHFVSQLGASVVDLKGEAAPRRPAAAAAEADDFVRAVVEGRPLDEAISKTFTPENGTRYRTAADLDTMRANLRQGSPKTALRPDQVDYAQQHPPSLRVKEQVSPAHSQAANDLLVRDARFSGVGADPTEHVRARQSYDSTFPVRADGELKTSWGEAAKLVQEEGATATPKRESWYGAPPEPPTAGHGPVPPGPSGFDPPGPVHPGPGPEPRPGPVVPESMGRRVSVNSAPHMPSSVRPPVKISSATNFLRGRSFGMLRGFAKVGGVLIGRPPTAGQTEVTDLQWSEVEGGRLRLRVTFRDGTKLTSIPHEADLVYQAIIYAADQRPTAVTMVTASPLLELKILVHPALLDSHLGEEISELDRFVDTYAGSSFKPRLDATMDVEKAKALYQLAWARRLATSMALVRDEAGVSAEDREFMEQYEATAQGVLANESRRKLAAEGLPLLKLSAEELSTRVPLMQKSEFYDSRLVKMMQTAAATASTLDDFLAKMEEASRAAAYKEDAVASLFPRLPGRRREPVLPAGRKSLDPAAIQRAMRPPPSFEVWSGVRERDYELAPAALVMTSADAPSPLTFMLQVAFTTEPGFLPGSDGKKAEDYSDEKPWEFDGIRVSLEKTVFDAVKNDAKSLEVLRRSTEFTYLQRFFRNGFDGNRLGPDFPLPQIEKLADYLRGKQPAPVPTPRWNSRRGGLETSLYQLVREAAAAKELKLGEKTLAWLKEAEPVIRTASTRMQADNRAFLELLGAADGPQRDAAWLTKWDEKWAEIEQRRVGWELAWDARLTELVQRRNELQEASPEEWMRDVEGGLLVQLHELSTGLAVRRQLGVHEDDKLMMRRRSAAEARAELAELAKYEALRQELGSLLPRGAATPAARPSRVRAP